MGEDRRQGGRRGEGSGRERGHRRDPAAGGARPRRARRSSPHEREAGQGEPGQAGSGPRAPGQREPSQREPSQRRSGQRRSGQGGSGQRGSGQRDAGAAPGTEAGRPGPARGGGRPAPQRSGGRASSPGRPDRGGAARPRADRGGPAESAPELPGDIEPTHLDPQARAELRTLPKDLADAIARHLVAAGRFLDADPERAYAHTALARRLAARVGIVREAAGLAAYRLGNWAEALSELRAARRITGRENYLPVMADAERGLGRPERALALARAPEASRLDREGAIELRIVESGARRDLGEHDAAVVVLQIPELTERRPRPWSARLAYAYADALLDAGRDEEARRWFLRAAEFDTDGQTDADERYADLAGLLIIDAEDAEEAGGEPADRPERS